MHVGFIGLGNVGAKLAGSLLRNNVCLSVFDLNADLVEMFTQRGAMARGSAADMMQSCDVVITCLPSPAISDRVMQDMLPFVQTGKIWMEMSTTDEAEVKRLGAQVIAAGGLAVDCQSLAAVTVLQLAISAFLQAVIVAPLKRYCRC